MTHYADDTHGGDYEPDEPYDDPEPRRWVFWVTMLATVIALGALAAWFYAKELGLTGSAPRVETINQTNAEETFPLTFFDQEFSVPEKHFRRIKRDEQSKVKGIELAISWPPPRLKFLAAETRPAADLSLREAVFVVIQQRTGNLRPRERLERIYPVYFSGEPSKGPGGLRKQDFATGSVYEGQELFIGDLNGTPRHYLCFIADDRLAPALCRAEKVAWEKFSVVYRFHRSHLGDWKAIEARVAQLLSALRQ